MSSSPRTTARIIIGRIEPWNNKIVVHISVVDIPASRDPGVSALSAIAHAPFEESALKASIGKLLATGVAPLADFETGYNRWRTQNGGIFTVTVAQAIGLGQKMFDQSK